MTGLLAVMAVVAVGAAGRLVSGAGHVRGLPVLVASGAAALVMLGAGLILRGDDDAPGDTAGDRANMRAVLLDTLADSAAAAGVAVTGAIILADPGLSWLDPAIALVIAAVVGNQALRLARQVIITLRREPPPAPPRRRQHPPSRRGVPSAGHGVFLEPSTASRVRRPIAAISGLSADDLNGADDRRRPRWQAARRGEAARSVGARGEDGTMPLQNRVMPTGEIVADPGRGLMMGNRGCLHGRDRQLACRRWRSQAWICCVLEWRGMRRDPMPPGRWTALFFLDEATALAAGHRPCAFCRRADFLDFAGAWREARRLAAPAAGAGDGLGAAPRAGRPRSPPAHPPRARR